MFPIAFRTFLSSSTFSMLRAYRHGHVRCDKTHSVTIVLGLTREPSSLPDQTLEAWQIRRICISRVGCPFFEKLTTSRVKTCASWTGLGLGVHVFQGRLSPYSIPPPNSLVTIFPPYFSRFSFSLLLLVVVLRQEHRIATPVACKSPHVAAV